MNTSKHHLFERASRLLAAVLLGGSIFAIRATAGEDPVAMPVRVWGYANSKYYQGEPGELDLSGSFMPTTPGGTDGNLYLMGTKNGTGQFYITNPTNQMALMEPGKSYSLGVDAFSITSVTFCISPPPGYQIEINGVIRESYSASVSAAPWAYSNTFTIRLLGPTNGMTGRAGSASSFANGRVHWRTALGSLRNGGSAGSLAIVDAGRDPTWSSVYTPGALQYETSSAEVTVYRSSGNIRQILADEACVDVVTTNSTTYHIDFYSVDQVSGSGFPHTFTGQPYVKYTVTQDGSGNKLKITSETRSITSATDTTTGVSRTAVTTLERTGTWPAFTWTMNDWNDSGQTQLIRDNRTWSSNGGNAHAETTTVFKPGDATNAIYTAKTYTHYNWGEQLTSETDGSGGSNPTTTYNFNTTTSAYGSYSFVNSASTTGGGWTAYEYFTASSPASNYIGVVKRIHRPFNNSPASVPTTLSTNTSGEITAYDYTTDYFGMRTRPTSIQTTVNNVVTASATISYADETANSMAVVAATRHDQTDSAGNYLTTVTRCYREDVADDFFRNQIHSVTQPDGTKQSYAYQRGTWSSGSFTVGSGSCARLAAIHGTTNSAGNATCSSLDGYTVDTVYLVSNRSTMDVTIRDAKGHVIHMETDAWNGSGWQKTTYVDYTYNICNQLTNRAARNGAQYDATYSGELKNSETDEAGMQTTYVYDYAGRVDTATKVGYSATPISISDLVTKYIYDAASRVTELHRGYGQTEQLIAYSAYDDAGRVTSETPPGLGATTYAYNPASRTKTATIPDSNTRIETYQPDGRLASITGTAVVSSYYSYSVAGDGKLTTQVNSGTSNSSRWVKTTTDWLGRKVTTDQPGFSFSSQADFTTQYAYSTTTGQLLTVTPTNTAPTRYAYSSLGLISSTGLDLDNNGLGASSGDRMTDQDHFFENDGTDWWLRDETYVYATAGSSTRTLVGVTRQRLTGFPSNRLAETKTTDADGNITTRTVDVVRTNKTLTNTTTSSGQTQAQTETVVDGLSLSTVTFQNLTIATGYDGLQRPITSADPRTGTTTTHYKAGTTLCSSVVTPVGTDAIMSYDYDNLGRTIWSENHDGKYVRYAYNARGQLQYQWGEACTPVEYGYDSIYGDRTTMKTYRNGSGWSSTTWGGATPGTADNTAWNYDTPSGLLRTKTDNSSKVTTFDYNARRQVATRTWAKSPGVTTYTYEDSSGYQTGELKQISYSDSTTPPVEFHRDDSGGVIDRRGLIRRVVDATGTRQFYYRTADAQLDYESLPSSFYGANGSSIARALTEAYDSSGMVGRSTGYKLGFGQNDSTNMSVAYGYESDKGRLQTVTMSGTVGSNSISGITYTYAYTTNSNLVATASNSSFTRTNTWHGTRDLPDEVDTTWTGSDRARFDYSYDYYMGRRTSEKLSGSIVVGLGYTYGYCDGHSFSDRSEVNGVTRQQLDSSYNPNGTYDTAKQRSWDYDGQGNRKTETRTGPSTATYTRNALNQYSSVSGFFSATFVNDDNGNLTDDGTWTYSYDGENRLSTMVKQDNSQRLEFTYDYVGRRVQKIVRSGPYSYSPITLQRKYAYEGWNMIAELDNGATPSVVHNFLWGLDLSGSIQGAGGVGGLLQMQDSSSRYFVVQNAMGNIRGLLDTGGGFVACYDYTPFGDLLSSSGSLASANPFRFSSKFTDDETGMVYYGFRYYSPILGRFINRDPVEEQGGLNLYGFCGNNAVGAWDYLGMTAGCGENGVWGDLNPALRGSSDPDVIARFAALDRLQEQERQNVWDLYSHGGISGGSPYGFPTADQMMFGYDDGSMDQALLLQHMADVEKARNNSTGSGSGQTRTYIGPDGKTYVFTNDPRSVPTNATILAWGTNYGLNSSGQVVVGGSNAGLASINISTFQSSNSISWMGQTIDLNSSGNNHLFDGTDGKLTALNAEWALQTMRANGGNLTLSDWNVNVKGGSVGHSMLSLPGDFVIASSFPNPLGRLFAAQQTLSYADTFYQENKGGGLHSFNGSVNVPNPTAALAAALYVDNVPNWFAMPGLNPSCTTNCVYSTDTILQAGGVPTGLPHLFPQGQSNYFNGR